MTTEQLQYGLFGSLGVTVAVLAVAVLLAHKHKVKAHIAGIVGFLITFVITVGFAEALGRRYDFTDPHVSYHIHLTLAFLATGLTLVPLGTGFQHWRGKCERKTHKLVSIVWFAFVVLALATGIWMLTEAELKTSAQESGVAPATSQQ